MKRKWTNQDDDLLVTLSQQAVPVADIAEHLERSYGSVVERRLIMKQSGRLERRGYAKHLEWTADEELRLEELLEQGYSIERCAKALKRSINSVRIKYKRIGLRLRADRRALTSRDVARVMGLGCAKTVVTWVEQGWLKPLYQKRPDHGTWRFDELALWGFVEIHEAHMAWEWQRITEPELQEHARSIRAMAPRWLRPTEVARRYHVKHSSVNDWIHRGLLPAKRWGNWWVCESALVGFTPPWALPRQPCIGCGAKLPPTATLFTRAQQRVCERCRPHYHQISTGTLIRVSPDQTLQGAA